MKKLAPLAAATAVAFALTSPAQAATIVVDQTPDPCTTNDPVCTFSFDGQVNAAGAFTDTGTFNLPQMGNTNGALISIAGNFGLGNIDFTRVFLTDSLANEFDFAIVNGALEQATIAIPTIAGGYTLTVQGTASSAASYGGDLTFTAVPEPGTWALMILGFGAIGFAMRGRKEKTRRISVNYA